MATQRPGSSAGHQLPRGRHGLTHGEVVENQRRRLIQAVPLAVREKGFAALTVEDMCARAGVSRRTFYENFRDAEACFVASYRYHVQELMAIVGGAGTAGRDWQERARLAMLALLRYLAERPDVAHMAVVEVLAAGPAAVAERDRASALLRSLIGDEALAAAPEPAPPLLLEVVAGATLELISARVLQGDSGSLDGLLPTVMYLVLVAAHGPGGAAHRAGFGDSPGATTAHGSAA
ncbi:MAG: TetR/AcrR family transcriptional regulator [Solirubrobacterales bacterium]|nr:TetR/AcrR family transcriptional regulator [Solirubrobacterales bacterium]MBV9166785.1 TetR/AcrR family transcriptional regulator [Solirubrobacterales bacterium]MBV9534305.1 TetR/AcrR family transcriptional regulator [Solirubrobacterales bacterium]